MYNTHTKETNKMYKFTWYVLSKLSYMNLVMSDVLPTVKLQHKFLERFIILLIIMNIPLCSPKNTNLNFLSGLPKSPEEDILKCYLLLQMSFQLELDCQWLLQHG